jgi:peroxiredoxin
MSRRVRLGLALLCVLLGVYAVVAWARSQPLPPRPDFTLKDMNGKRWTLSEQRGKGPVVLCFFATWCTACAEELPELVKLREKYADRGVQLVLVTAEQPEKVRYAPRLLEIGATVLTTGEPVFRQYGIETLPHTIVFDREGKVVFDSSGYSPDSIREIDVRLNS